MLGKLGEHDISSLRKCVSAGETLPKATFDAWHEATGIKILDGIGATEMLHIFIGSPEDEMRAGLDRQAVPGYEARVVDDDGHDVPPGTVGRLAVRGPTGCRYLADERQRKYVQNGWNITGDTYLMDADGYFWYQARSDDMIISAGYNIAGPGGRSGAAARIRRSPNAAWSARPTRSAGRSSRPTSCCAPATTGDAAMTRALQDFVKATIAPYKYPRAIEFVAELPKTQTGKLQRFELRRTRRRTAPRASSPREENAVTRTERVRRAARDDEPRKTLQPPGWPRAEGLRQRHQGARRVRLRRRHGRLGRARASFRKGFVAQAQPGAGEHRRGARRRRRRRRSTSCG